MQPAARPNDDTPKEDNQPPSERLPEPSSDDYGAANFNAPGDAELDRAAKTHSLPGNKLENRLQENSEQAAQPASPAETGEAD
jgi:hypothetical protein